MPGYTPGRSIEAVARELGLNDIVKLASNESLWGPSPAVLQAAQNALSRLHQYPEVIPIDLVNALVQHSGFSQDHLLVGNGADELLRLVATVYVRPGDRVLYPQPSFAAYAYGASLMGGRGVPIALTSKGHMDLDAMAEQVDESTSLIYLCSPNNPTGGIFRQRAWDTFLTRVAHRAVIVVDQAYREFVDDPGYAHIEDDIQAGAPVVMVRTFSKLYGLAGARIGWLAAPPEIIQLLMRVREPFSLNTIGLAAALKALEDHEYFDRVQRETLQLRGWLRRELEERGYRLLDSQANFLTFDCQMDALGLAKLMERKGVIIRPTTSFGLDGHCRVSIAPRPLLERFLQALDEVTSSIRGD